jgi:formylglycine-generating enzyme
MNRFLLLASIAVCLPRIALADGRQTKGMVLIPAGTYSPLFTEKDAPRTVIVAPFFLDLRPVTNAEFLRFVFSNPKWRRSEVSPIFAETGYLADWAGDLTLGDKAPDDAPVVEVSWFAASAYARWLGLRLPTTAEWERAAAIGFTVEDGSGEPAYRESVLRWFSVPTPAKLAAAGSGRPDFFGIRDLTDLVWEWVEDFNAAQAAGNPDLDKNLVCGGAGAGASDFTNYPAFARSEFRGSLNAPYAVPNLGFRCARSL